MPINNLLSVRYIHKEDSYLKFEFFDRLGAIHLYDAEIQLNPN